MPSCCSTVTFKRHISTSGFSGHLSSASPFSQLKSLTLMKSFVLSEADFVRPLQCWQLECLVLHSCVLSAGFFQCLVEQSSRHLIKLCLAGCRQVGVDIVNRIVSQCARLKWLILGSKSTSPAAEWKDELQAAWPDKAMCRSQSSVCCLAEHFYVLHRNNCLAVCFN